MNLKVLAEASPTIGLGHLTRSLALVQMVRNLVTPVFYGKDDNLVIDKLREEEIAFQKIGDAEDFIDEVSSEDIVLLDGYEYSGSFQKAVRERCRTLMVIDDKHDKTYYADYLINHAPGISEADYQTNDDCTFLLGPDFALLRPAFLRDRKKNIASNVEKIVVCFGGADPENKSYQVVELLLSFKQIKEVILILGPAYSFFSSLELLANDSRLNIFRNLSENKMAETLKSADVAIVPSSGILYECLGLGIPSLAGYYVDNQSLLYKGWLEQGAIIGIEQFDRKLIAEKMQEVMDGKIDLSKLVEKNPVDGQSPKRFQEVFEKIINKK